MCLLLLKLKSVSDSFAFIIIFLPFYSQKADCFSMTLHDPNVTFPKMKLKNSRLSRNWNYKFHDFQEFKKNVMTFHVTFHDHTNPAHDHHKSPC